MVGSFRLSPEGIGLVQVLDYFGGPAQFGHCSYRGEGGYGGGHVQGQSGPGFDLVPGGGILVGQGLAVPHHLADAEGGIGKALDEAPGAFPGGVDVVDRVVVGVDVLVLAGRLVDFSVPLVLADEPAKAGVIVAGY